MPSASEMARADAEKQPVSKAFDITIDHGSGQIKMTLDRGALRAASSISKMIAEELEPHIAEVLKTEERANG